MPYTASDILYDPVAHRSVDPDGIDVPHVTHLLGEVGLSTDFEELRLTSRRLAAAIDYKCQLGSTLHADSHAYDDDDLDWTTVHPDVAPYLRAWATCRHNLSLRPTTRERRVYHPLYRYTGILDGIFLVPPAVKGRREKRILLDLKLGDPDSAAAHLQTAAYEAAYVYDHPTERIDERWAVQLVPGRTIPYIVTNYSARQAACRDFQIFMAALTVYNHQPARRPRDF